MRRWVVLLALVALAGCKPKADASADLAAPAADKAVTSSGAPLAQLAYQFDYRLAAPAANVEGLFNAHERACLLAGRATCQVISASLEHSGEHLVLGQLQMRATAAWAEQFRMGLDRDARAAGGRIDRATTASDDLTGDIASNAAAIPAAAAERDRLAKDIDTRKAKLNDAVSGEDALKSAQNDLDSARASLRQDLAKVETSTISLTYQPIEGMVPADATQAVSGAMGGFIGHTLKALAAVITLVSYLWPLALFGAGAVWLGLRLKRKDAAEAMRSVATSGADD
jgi:hypothetical protein